MSFDTEFLYGNVTSVINTHINSLANRRNEANVQLAAIESLSNPSLTYIKTQKTQDLNSLISSLDIQISELNTIKGKISDVENLSGNNKNLIYDFYSTYVSEEKKYFMSRLLDYSGNIILDSGNIMSSNISMSDAKAFANLLCHNYPKTSRAARWVHRTL